MPDYSEWSEEEKELYTWLFKTHVTDMIDDMWACIFRKNPAVVLLHAWLIPDKEVRAAQKTTPETRVTIRLRHNYTSAGPIKIEGIKEGVGHETREFVTNYLLNLRKLQEAADSLAKGHLVKEPQMVKLVLLNDKDNKLVYRIRGTCNVNLNYTRKNQDLPSLPKNGIEAVFVLDITHQGLEAAKEILKNTRTE